MTAQGVMSRAVAWFKSKDPDGLMKAIQMFAGGLRSMVLSIVFLKRSDQGNAVQKKPADRRGSFALLLSVTRRSCIAVMHHKSLAQSENNFCRSQRYPMSGTCR